MNQYSRSYHDDETLIPVAFENKNKPIVFQSGHQVELNSQTNEIKVFTEENTICLHVIMTEQGPVLNFENGGIRLKAKENLTLESEEIHLKAEKSVTIQSDGDYKQNIKGDATSKARIQNIQARLGNVNIQANDDVRLDGERVKLNCSK